MTRGRTRSSTRRRAAEVKMFVRDGPWRTEISGGQERRIGGGEEGRGMRATTAGGGGCTLSSATVVSAEHKERQSVPRGLPEEGDVAFRQVRIFYCSIMPTTNDISTKVSYSN